jgi:hypothetical protein
MTLPDFLCGTVKPERALPPFRHSSAHDATLIRRKNSKTMQIREWREKKLERLKTQSCGIGNSKSF